MKTSVLTHGWRGAAAFAAICAGLSVVAYSDTADTYEGVCAGKRFTVSAGELWRDNESVGRSGHMGHALVNCGNGRILDFTSNCAGRERCNGHSGYGWMEYRISDDYGKTFGPARVLPCSKKMFDEGRHTALCEKAVRAPDGRIVLFFQITDPSQSICCEPWFEPLMAVSTDNGETFSDFLPTGADRGRIYDAVCDDRYIYFLMPANPHFAGTRPEHVYKVYRAGPDLKFTPFVLPLDAQGRGYGALEFAKDGTLHAYAYNTKCETEMDYTLSRDRGETWSKPGRSHVAIKIRNPQVRRLDDVWFLIGRNGASPSDALAFYTSLDGVNWDAGVKLDVKPAGTGTGYYSCMLPIHEPGRPPRMLMQYSRPYRGSCVNVMHRVITLGEAPPAARTLAEWPLGCDEKGRPDGRCAVSSANDLLVMDVTHVGKLGDGRTALMASGGMGASDFAYSDEVGRYVTPTNDFTLEGWYSFARLPRKGETWMVASAFQSHDRRWFLTLRRDSIHKGLTWQIFSAAPKTGDSLLTTVTDPNTLTNGWHRFALTFAHRTAAGEAEWRFYLDGRLSGRRVVKAFEGTVNRGWRFALGGRGLSGNVIAGSLSCCRLSDRVLLPGEFLPPDKAHVGTPCWKALPVHATVPDTPDCGRTLYNGIVLPKEWPPRIDPKDPNPIKAPYLEAANIPKVIPIDVGRQLFVDDFLVEATTGVVRAFYKPMKYEGNPVMWRQTKEEMSAQAPGCAMSGGGVWWDPTRRKFRMWYMSGFAGRISYAESPDGVNWERPPVGPNGDNVVLPNQTSDTFSVFPGYDTDAPYANWRICISPGGNPTRSAEYVSSDGVRWRFLRRTGQHGDCTTMFHNPFLGKWVWSLRAGWRHRSRIYHAHRDFYAGGGWHFPLGRPQTNTVDCALWLACDNQDLPRTMGDGKTYTNSQLYNVDAVPYESVMVGLFKILCGYENDIAARVGMPKTTSIHFAYSRDGFHFTRPDRTPAIDESGWGSGAWDSGYVGNISSCFAIKDERLWFYYVGARGDGTQNNPPRCVYANGMHWNFSVGVATLRRDGFAGMVADGRGELVTRPVTFSGAHLFVNADARFGEVAAEVLDEKGEPYPGYSAADCKALARTDSTKHAITWTGGDLSRFAGRSVRFRFKMKVATLFSFWVSKKPTGESGGYVAAGGPDYKGLKDE